MAEQMIWRPIGIEDESFFGASVAGTAKRMSIVSTTLGQVPNKDVVKETTNTSLGPDRFKYKNDVVGGDMKTFGTPAILHQALEFVMGTTGSSSALGSSAVLMNYAQDTSGRLLSKTVVLDRNNTQEKFSGVIGKSIELSANNDLLDVSLSVLAKSRNTGVSLVNTVGETLKPFAFSDMVITYSPGATMGANPVTVAVDSWKLKFDNGVDGTFLSGSKNLSRADKKDIPKLEGSFKIFHEGSTLTDGTFGCSEYYVRFQGTLTSCDGLIAGVTPYSFQADCPRVFLKTIPRNYETGALSMEEVTFEGLVNSGMSVLWRPRLIVGTNDL